MVLFCSLTSWANCCSDGFVAIVLIELLHPLDAISFEKLQRNERNLHKYVSALLCVSVPLCEIHLMNSLILQFLKRTEDSVFL